MMVRITDGAGGWYTTETGERIRLSNQELAEGDYQVVESFGSPSEGMVAEAKERIATMSEPDVTDSQVDERIADLEAQLAEANATIDELRPEKSIASFLFNTPEDVIAHFGAEAIDAKVEEILAAHNRDRARKGFDREQITPERFAKERVAFIAGLLEDRAKSQPPKEGWLDRTLKMLKPNGQLVQIPYEGQVNNVAGSLADGYVRYERKGYKRTDPMLCPSKDCWQESVVAGGKFVFSGYCSEDHFNRTEKGQVDGLTG